MEIEEAAAVLCQMRREDVVPRRVTRPPEVIVPRLQSDLEPKDAELQMKRKDSLRAILRVILPSGMFRAQAAWIASKVYPSDRDIASLPGHVKKFHCLTRRQICALLNVTLDRAPHLYALGIPRAMSVIELSAFTFKPLLITMLP